jgi:hypothetical protein
VSWYDGVPAVLLYAGPPQNYPAAAAAATTAQSLITGASGGYSQARIPATFAQVGKQGFWVGGKYKGIVTASTAATTMTINIGLASTSNTITGTGTATIISTSQAVVINSTTAGLGWGIDFDILYRGTGYGTTSVSSSILTTSTLRVNTSTATATAVATIAESVPLAVTTIDSSVDQWVYATVTFSTSSTTNSCTLEQTILLGAS